MIFVDSGAWIALLNQKDPHHDDAVAIYNDLVQQNAQLLTTDYVIDETVTRLRYDWSHSGAVQFLNFIKRTKEATEEVVALTVAEIDNLLFKKQIGSFVNMTLRGYHLQIAPVLQSVSSITSRRRLLSINIF
jgi:predicted nucleic acid-binding protein